MVQPFFFFLPYCLCIFFCPFSSSSSLIFTLSQSDFTVELFRYIVWLQPCVCAAEWPLRAPVSDVALSMRRMSLTSVQLLSKRVAPQPLTPHQREREREKERETEREVYLDLMTSFAFFQLQDRRAISCKKTFTRG